MVMGEEGVGLGGLVDAKEIKVKIPIDFHIKLHTLKVLKGQSISDTVGLALAKYFNDFPSEERAAFHAMATRAINVYRP